MNNSLVKAERLSFEIGMSTIAFQEFVYRIISNKSRIITLDADTLYDVAGNWVDNKEDFNLKWAKYEELYKLIDSFSKEDILEVLKLQKNILSFSLDLEMQFINYIKNSTSKSILIVGVEGYSINLYKLIKSLPNINFDLIVNNPVCTKLVNEVYKDLMNVKIVPYNLYGTSFTDEIKSKYDLIIAIPTWGNVPISSRDELNNSFMTDRWDLIATENLLKCLTEKGTLKIILAPPIMFGMGKIKDFRDYLVKNYNIYEVSSLPAGVFERFTMIKTVMITLGKLNTSTVKIKHYEFKNLKRRDFYRADISLEAELSMTKEEFARLDDWNIDLLLVQDSDLQQFKDSQKPTVKIKDIATIFRGKAISKVAAGDDVKVINISDINEGKIDYEKTNGIEIEPRKVASYILEDKDILISSRGTIIKVAMYEEQKEKYIPSVNFSVIRIHDDRIRSEYVAIFFNTEIGKKLLNSLQRGAVIMNINSKDLNSIDIPLVSLEEQDSLIAKYNDEYNKYISMLDKITKCWINCKQDINEYFLK